MSAAYAVTFELDPGDGDVVVQGGRRVRAASPMRAVVLAILRTDLGSFVPDPTRGVDYGILLKATTGAAAAWRAAILAALARLTGPGLITDLAVTAQQSADRMLYTVEFRDPRAPTARPHALKLVA